MGELMTTEEAAALLDVQPNTLAKWRRLDAGPPFVKVGRNVRYRRRDLAEWLDGQRVLPGMSRL